MTLKICIVSSKYNEKITDGIYKNAVVKLNVLGIKKFDSISVPGAFEIPVAISKIIKKYDGVIAVGCIIKGETPNFDFISKAITNGIMELSILNKKPIGNAIITCLNREQALARFNKGAEASLAVLEVLKIK
jgi:6,7-dimethyl-8-ribityllumazine synthase|tara:strand:- start:1702 stop:2097 length:396 start_codon:yes stop_codon:yes gene_type:complete